MINKRLKEIRITCVYQNNIYQNIIDGILTKTEIEQADLYTKYIGYQVYRSSFEECMIEKTIFVNSTTNDSSYD